MFSAGISKVAGRESLFKCLCMMDEEPFADMKEDKQHLNCFSWDTGMRINPSFFVRKTKCSMCCGNFYLVANIHVCYISAPRGDFLSAETNTINTSYATKTTVSESTGNACMGPTQRDGQWLWLTWGPTTPGGPGGPVLPWNPCVFQTKKDTTVIRLTLGNTQ